MAVVGPTLIHDLTPGGSVRLRGGLAAAATIANGNTYRERLALPPNAGTINLRFKMDVSAGTPTIQLVPQTANIERDSLTVSSVTTGLTSATSVVDDTELVHSYTSKGERVVDVLLDATPASAAGTVTYCDVSVTTQ